MESISQNEDKKENKLSECEFLHILCWGWKYDGRYICKMSNKEDRNNSANHVQ